ncbi:WD repeat-containing protein 86 isoform X8 [Gorilla gorilla gorilla]|uniref:WD repeat-containing protein 86 isoform X8 n=1 Tax=Gorilla gorilla gorilla TaxID=9595 RepID=UPI002445EE47|nr:WD repeat-containing protein 86 isoform X8 [Gorilla gorilla gorilla]
MQRRLHHQEVGRADRAVSAGVPRTHVHCEQDPGCQQPALQQLLRPDSSGLECGQGADVPGVPGPPQLRADSSLLCPVGPPQHSLRGGGRGRGASGDRQHRWHGQGVAGGQRLLPPDAAGPHRRSAVPSARHARPHGLHRQHRRHHPCLGHPEWGAAAGVPGAPGLRHLSGVFTGSGDACARAFDVQSGELRRVFRGHTFIINCIQVHGQVLYTASHDGALRLWDVRGLRGAPRPPPPTRSLSRLFSNKVPGEKLQVTVSAVESSSSRCREKHLLQEQPLQVEQPFQVEQHALHSLNAEDTSSERAGAARAHLLGDGRVRPRARMNR